MTEPSEPAPSTELSLPQPAADQFAYHVRMGAVFAVAGQTDERASEALPAWAMQTSQWPAAESSAAEIGAELIDQRVGIAVGPGTGVVGQPCAGVVRSTSKLTSSSSAARREHRCMPRSPISWRARPRNSSRRDDRPAVTAADVGAVMGRTR